MNWLFNDRPELVCRNADVAELDTITSAGWRDSMRNLGIVSAHLGTIDMRATFVELRHSCVIEALGAMLNRELEARSKK